MVCHEIEKKNKNKKNKNKKNNSRPGTGEPATRSSDCRLWTSPSTPRTCLSAFGHSEQYEECAPPQPCLKRSESLMHQSAVITTFPTLAVESPSFALLLSGCGDCTQVRERRGLPWRLHLAKDSGGRCRDVLVSLGDTCRGQKILSWEDQVLGLSVRCRVSLSGQANCACRGTRRY